MGWHDLTYRSCVDKHIFLPIKVINFAPILVRDVHEQLCNHNSNVVLLATTYERKAGLHGTNCEWSFQVWVFASVIRFDCDAVSGRTHTCD